MKTKRLLALLTAAVMVLGVLPGIGFAEDTQANPNTVVIETNKTITQNIHTGELDEKRDKNNPDPDNSLYIYHSNWNQRNGYVGFELADKFTEEQLSDKYYVKKATLNVYASSIDTKRSPGVSVVAIDNTLWNEEKYTAPETLGLPVYNITSTTTAVPEDMVEIDRQDISSVGDYNFDVTSYVAENLAALQEKGISFALISITKSGETTGDAEAIKLIIDGKNGENKPTLTVEFAEAASVELSLVGPDDLDLGKKTIKNLASGSEYTPTDTDAPVVIAHEGKYYVRGELTAATLGPGVNNVTVEYTEAAIESVAEPENVITSVIDGNRPILPKYLSATLEGEVTADVPVEWKAGGELKAGETVTYTAKVDGYDGDAITVDIEVFPCDNNVYPFYTAGNSDGAKFDWNNKLGYIYAGGNVIFELDFEGTEGSNKLFSYGDETTAAFNGTGPIIRYASQPHFEYYDPDVSPNWFESKVPYEVGKTYRLRTEVDVTAKTYRMWITDEDGVTYAVTEAPVKFRNSDLTKITMMFHHGAGYTGEENANGMISHRTYWKDGWSNLAITYVDADGKELKSADTVKAATGVVYTYTYAPKVIKKEGKFYILPDINSLPATADAVKENSDNLTVTYGEATPSVKNPDDIIAVTGDAMPALPAEAAVNFNDGATDQALNYPVEWNTENVKMSEAGEYTVTGEIKELGLQLSCKITVKDLIKDDGSQLNKVTVATNNGGWNWYVEPSGTHIQPGDKLAQRYQGETTDIDGKPIIYHSGGYEFQHDRTYMGWVEDDGDIVVAQYDHDTDEYTRRVIHSKLESDDHNNPAVVVLPDGRIMAIYSMHTNEPYMYFRVTKEPEDISEWNDEQFYHGENANATYPSVFMVHDDPDFPDQDVIYIGWRGVHWMPTLAKFPIPDTEGKFPVKTNSKGEPDGIKPLMEQTQFANTTFGYSTWDNNKDAPGAYTDGGNSDRGRRPYTKYDYDFDRNVIYITFTASHPDNDIRNHIFYLTLDIPTQTLRTAKGTELQPLPKENAEKYKNEGAEGTSGQWGVVTSKLYEKYPELVVFNASELTGEEFNPKNAKAERRGWTWDIIHNSDGEPCIVYADITATPPVDGTGAPTWYKAASAIDGKPYGDDDSRTYHYYWYARWDKDGGENGEGEWVKTYLTYGGKWFHQNATQERCYSGGLTFDHNYPGNVIYLSIPTNGKYGLVHEIYRWESDDKGATWTKRQAITENSPTPNARPNAIYNYKMNDEGTDNAGPRLLWKSGEYRYWMNYEYKTGVKTDFKAEGFITQDDPEMFADAYLGNDVGEELAELPVGEATVTGKFKVTNISIGDGTAAFAVAHYGADGALKGVATAKNDAESYLINIPARSVPQTSIIGADKDENRANGLSAMGDPEVSVEIPYTATFEEGDRVKLFAWNMGIEQMKSIMQMPFEISTDGNRDLMREDFSYDGSDKLRLDEDTDGLFGDWEAKGYDSNGSVDFADNSYAAVTKAPFGNTALHLYRVGGQGIMASHTIPDTGGKDYTLEFTMRYIAEMSWRNISNQGFTLSNGIPTKKGDTEHPSAFQFRMTFNSDDENGRGTYGKLISSTAFDEVNQSNVFHNVALGRDLSDSERFARADYTKGVGYYDNVDGIYIHDYNDSLYIGSLFRVKVNVHPGDKTVDMSVFDGYRTASCRADYNNAANGNWDENPINTITFSVGSDTWGEIYIDDLCMHIADENDIKKNVTIAPASGSALALGSQWTMYPYADGSVTFFAPDDKAMDVGGQSTSVGATVSTYEFNNGDNQKFYLVGVKDGYLIRGKQSNLYLASDPNSGALTLQKKSDATVFTITDSAAGPSAAVLEIIRMIEDGTYEPTMDALFPEEEEITGEPENEPADVKPEIDFVEEI